MVGQPKHIPYGGVPAGCDCCWGGKSADVSKKRARQKAKKEIQEELRNGI
jgi:hypothetical protein